MATTVTVPVSEYLSQTYEPDCDYVDGELEERNVGEQQRGELQGILIRIFGINRFEWQVRLQPETRVQVATNRYRVPDICLVDRRTPRETIIRTPPVLCVEILSPEDRMSRIQTRINDYMAMGVKAAWVLDPLQRVGYAASRSGFEQPVDGVLRVAGTPVEIVLADVFAELDEA